MTATASEDASVLSPSVDSHHSPAEIDENLAKEQQVNYILFQSAKMVTGQRGERVYGMKRTRLIF